jgi:hypothetical protein
MTLSVDHQLGILAVAKVLIPVKAKFMGKGFYAQMGRKTHQNLLVIIPKKKEL